MKILSFVYMKHHRKTISLFQPQSLPRPSRIITMLASYKIQFIKPAAVFSHQNMKKQFSLPNNLFKT